MQYVFLGNYYSRYVFLTGGDQPKGLKKICLDKFNQYSNWKNNVISSRYPLVVLCELGHQSLQTSPEGQKVGANLGKFAPPW